MSASADVRAGSSSGRHDPAARRRSLRQARQRGCSVYVPAEVLEAAGIDPDGPPPYYRTWAGRKGSVMVQLYREP